MSTSIVIPPPRILSSKGTELRFWAFITKGKLNRTYLMIAVFGSILQFVIFKILYPFPDFLSDSYSYIATNQYAMSVNLWPIGYSKFLAFVHQISPSDTLLVAIQYSLVEGSLGYLFYTVLYLYRPRKKTICVLFITLFFNPLFLYLSNCVLSDAVFVALSVTLLVLFLWMFHGPSITQVILQGILIGLAFTLRYAAIYYPVVAIAGLALSSQRWPVKMWGTMTGLALMIPFYFYTAQKTKEITGTAEFSVLRGWHIANNALYMYDHITVDSTQLPAGTLELDRMAREFYKKVPLQYRELETFPGAYFIKVPFAVLKPYMAARYPDHDYLTEFAAWGKVSPLYYRYGSWLIQHYPLSFARYFLWPNTKNYFTPYLEKFDSYNLGLATVPSGVQDWFDLITPDVRSVSTTFQGKLFFLYPPIFMVLNLYFVSFIGWLIFTRRLKYLQKLFRNSLLFVSTFLLINFCFSVYAAVVLLRYQVISMIFLVTFCLLLIEMTNNSDKSVKIEL
jgi:hypothetical protein